MDRGGPSPPPTVAAIGACRFGRFARAPAQRRLLADGAAMREEDVVKLALGGAA